MLASAWWVGLREPNPIVPSMQDETARIDGQNLSPPGGTLAIAIGDRLPQWEIEGWLNGPPPAAAQLVGKVVVVDVWNDL